MEYAHDNIYPAAAMAISEQSKYNQNRNINELFSGESAIQYILVQSILVPHIFFFLVGTVVSLSVLICTKKLPVCNVWMVNGNPQEADT